MKAINPGHFLLTCRLDNWVHLLEENHFHIARDRLPQALYISATALALAPAAAAESLIYRKRIRETKIEKDPIFILGHWRSGTTYLQNVLSRDEQFGWFDPVNTIGLPYSLLLGRLIQPPIEKGIQNGRPQDNVQYSLDLPMEETFGVLTISPYSIIHMIAFPENYKKYIEGAFVSDLPVEELRKWAAQLRLRRPQAHLHQKGQAAHSQKPGQHRAHPRAVGHVSGCAVHQHPPRPLQDRPLHDPHVPHRDGLAPADQRAG